MKRKLPLKKRSENVVNDNYRTTPQRKKRLKDFCVKNKIIKQDLINCLVDAYLDEQEESGKK